MRNMLRHREDKTAYYKSSLKEIQNDISSIKSQNKELFDEVGLTTKTYGESIAKNKS